MHVPSGFAKIATLMPECRPGASGGKGVASREAGMLILKAAFERQVRAVRRQVISAKLRDIQRFTRECMSAGINCQVDSGEMGGLCFLYSP
jgi:hypothetical protein